ncbi:Carboxylic ester hydrolase [Fusarium albosuccineum]|uniref:Carboxylic ester hydrolase n=1 Tax=Fusarium albosuccineum TaxID=1237068 RepID=A0A8H4LCS4_9HYPO|nr:Carboxylic ester hydrolase [Fusarium albosuccineum]
MAVQERIPPESPAYRLSSALAEDEPSLRSLADPWSSFFRPATLAESRQNAITAVIASESEKLRETWVKFQESRDPADRLDLDTTSPTMEGIMKLVSQGFQHWNDKRQEGRQGTVSKKFHRFCNSVDSHKSLMKVLPESHEYFSLFMGSVTAVVQASVNHETIVENFAKALDDITTLIEECHRDLTIFPHDEMMSLVVDLYTCIFQFLRRCFEWLMKPRHKRAVDSFNEKLAELLQKDMLEVKEKARRIRLHATQSGLADGRITRHHVEGMNEEIRLLREDNERMASRVDEMRDSCRQLAQLIQNKLLLPQATDFLDDQSLSIETQQRRVAWYSRPSSILSIEDVTNEGSVHAETTLEKAYRALDMSFDKQRVKLTAEGFLAGEVSPQMLQSLINWLEDEAGPSTFIWLQGPTTWAEDHENPMSMLAARLIEMSGEINLRNGQPMPLISYFCSISRQSPREGNPSREAEGAYQFKEARGGGLPQSTGA